MAKLIRFDWAIKYILRDKANFDILEGFLSAVLQEDVRVIDLLESEGNQEREEDKFNRVDLLVKNAREQLILIEVQVNTEQDFFYRLAYSAAKLIVQYIEKGKPYGDIKKVFIISILYFNLGTGDDYVYHGATNFVGIHKQDTLQLTGTQRRLFGYREVRNIFPEHYLLRVAQFKDEVQNDLDEWLYMLKHEEVKPEFDAKHIQTAGEKLRVLNLDEKERQAYDHYMENRSYQASMEQSALIEAHEHGYQAGVEQGIERGIEQGQLREKRRTLILLLQQKFPDCPQAIIGQIEQMDKLVQLDEWFLQTLAADSWQSIFGKQG
ncbi:MAG: Rpn family recombination-promoting nuclease/putative transposase [Caldilineaceae bacterium]